MLLAGDAHGAQDLLHHLSSLTSNGLPTVMVVLSSALVDDAVDDMPDQIGLEGVGVKKIGLEGVGVDLIRCIHLT